MKKIVLYIQIFVPIGGIETSIINFVKSLHTKYDITLVTEEIGLGSLEILEKYIKVVTEVTEEITCDTLLICSIDFVPETIEKIKYDHVYHESHAFMKDMNKIWGTKYIFRELPGIKYISCSQCCHDSLKEDYDIDSILIPNIVLPSVEKKKILRLCSATRLTEEKGFWRMKALCDILEANNIPYVWDVYTNQQRKHAFKKPYKDMVYRYTKPDICSYYNNYDYVVQLSDTESFCYTMYEALVNHVPVLVTPFPTAKAEIKNGKNGYILPFDMNIDKELVQKIYSEIPTKVNYKPKDDPVDLWKKLLK